MDVTVYRKKKARVGIKNGRARLTDPEVRLIRAIAAVAGRAAAERAFGLTARHTNRIRTGAARLDAGGIIIRPQITVEPDADEGVGFDASKTIRCGRCGAKTHPSRRDMTRCVVCVS